MPEACNGKQNGLVKVQYAKLPNISCNIYEPACIHLALCGFTLLTISVDEH